MAIRELRKQLNTLEGIFRDDLVAIPSFVLPRPKGYWMKTDSATLCFFS